MAIVLVMLAALVLSGMAAAFLLAAPMDLTAAGKNLVQNEAGLAADAGVRDSMAWIAHTLGNAGEPCTSATPVPVRTGTLNGWDWRCEIQADPQTPPHGLDNLRLYLLTSTASRDGEDAWRIRTWVQAGQSFAEFGEFTDQNTGAWDMLVAPGWTSEGPIHHNGILKLYIVSSFFTGPTPASPAFDDKVTTSGVYSSSPDGVQYAGSANAPYNYSDGYDRLLAGGRPDLQTGTAQVPMPNDASLQAVAAWGGTPPATPPAGVTVNPAGGVFISGDVDSMTMSVNGSGNFVLTIVQAGQTTTIEEDGSQRTVTYPDATVASVPGAGSGVIFSTGHIHSLAGTNKGAHTICTDFGALKDIEITGDILRADTPEGTKPTTADDRLGIIANRIRITDNTSLVPRNSTDTLNLYASLFARDRLYVESYNSGSAGRMAIYGGLSSGYTPMYGTFNTSTGSILTGMSGLNGIGSPNLYYDTTLANEPPPRYPTTSGEDLSIRYWQESPL